MNPSPHPFFRIPPRWKRPGLAVVLLLGAMLTLLFVRWVNRSIPLTVKVNVDGQALKVASLAPTVSHLLEEVPIQLGPTDYLSVDPATPVTNGLEIRVIRRSVQRVVSHIEVPYGTVRRADRAMTVGQTAEVQAGEPGIIEMERTVVLEDGEVVSNEIVKEVMVRQPVDQVIAYGTTAVVSRGGIEYRYSEAIEMIATGYTAGPESNPVGTGYTYTGMKAVRGVVAVDPRVIPLYTRVYVEGYGPAVAADIGGAIKGNKIDLCFDTVAEALQWGRQPVKVYILD